MKVTLLIFLAAMLSSVDALGLEVDESKIATPDDALAALIAGNERFVSGKPLNQDFARQIEKTKLDQAPYAEDIHMLGSFEFAKYVEGTKLLVVMDHRSCGAVGGACEACPPDR